MIAFKISDFPEKPPYGLDIWKLSFCMRVAIPSSH